MRLEPLYHQDIAGTCRSKDGCAERESMSLRGMGVIASGKLEKGGRDSNSETFHCNPAG